MVVADSVRCRIVAAQDPEAEEPAHCRGEGDPHAGRQKQRQRDHRKDAEINRIHGALRS